MTMIKTNESGRSMIEMLGVLAIIGVLSVGGIAGYSKAMNKFKTNKVADNVSMLIANIKTMYAQQNSFNGLNNTTAVSMGLVPDELVDDAANGTLSNAYNGAVTIKAAKSLQTGDDELAFTIQFDGLSREACMTLATNDWGSSYSSGLIAIKGDKDAITDDSNMYMGCPGSKANNVACPGIGTAAKNDTALSVPMDVAAAATACSCKDGNKCSIMWKYY